MSNGFTVKVNSCRTYNDQLNDEALSQENKMMVYPNPTNSYFTFELQDSLDYTGDAQVELFNTRGQQVYKCAEQIENGQLVHTIEVHNNSKPEFIFCRLP